MNTIRKNIHNYIIIDFCKEWDKFAPFCKWALENGYEENLTLDRIDNSKGYFADNCRWVSLLEQTNNRNTNTFYEYNGETHTLAEWSGIYDLNYDTLLSRYAIGVRGAELFRPSKGKKKDGRFDNIKYSDKTLMSWNKKKLILYIKKLYAKHEIAEQMKEVEE